MGRKANHPPERVSNLRVKLLLQPYPMYVIAARAGMSPTQLSQYSLQYVEVPVHHLENLAKVLDCDVEELVGFWDAR